MIWPQFIDSDLIGSSMDLIVYNLRGAFLGSVTPVPEQKDFRTQSTSIYQYKDMELSSEILIWVFWDYTKMF